MRSLLASIFRLFFKIRAFKNSYYGFYKRIFKPWKSFKGVEKTISYRGKMKILLDLGDWNQQRLYFTRNVEEKEIRFTENYLKEGDSFLDLGANIGLFTLTAASKVGKQGKVFAFEPWPLNHERLCINTGLNNFGNISAERLAISDKEGELELRLDESEQNNGMVTSFSPKFSSKAITKSISIDQYLAGNICPSIRLIKIDIEGGEYQALLGMRETLQKFKPAILMEINPDIIKHTPFTQADIENLLGNLGYQKFYLDKNGQRVIKKTMDDDSNNYLFVTPSSIPL